MSIQVTAQIIQFILAPVVMITSCALLIGGMLTQYSSIGDRVRIFTRERLDLLRMLRAAQASGSSAADDFIAERLGEIDAQVPHLLRRHQLVRNALLASYLSILCFVVSMLVIAVAALTASPAMASAALFLFLGSTAVLLFGLAQIAQNIRISQRTLQYEARRVMGLSFTGVTSSSSLSSREE